MHAIQHFIRAPGLITASSSVSSAPSNASQLAAPPAATSPHLRICGTSVDSATELPCPSRPPLSFVTLPASLPSKRRENPYESGE